MIAVTKDKIVTAASETGSAGKVLGLGIVDGLSKVVDQIKNEFNHKPKSLEEAKQAIKNILNELANGSSQLAEDLKHEIENSKTVEDVKRVIEKVSKVVGDKLRDILASVY